jgi:hypothetical protein
LACQLVQPIRRRLKESDINANSSWRTLREIMSTQCRITASFRRADGKALHVRKSHPGGTGANGYLSCLKSEPGTRRYQQDYCLKH